jgi:hypothetical protein
MRFRIWQTPRQAAKRQEAIADERHRMREARKAEQQELTEAREVQEARDDEFRRLEQASEPEHWAMRFGFFLNKHGRDLFGDDPVRRAIPDAVPMPSGDFEVQITLASRKSLVLRCRHEGNGVITCDADSRRFRVEPEERPLGVLGEFRLLSADER